MNDASSHAVGAIAASASHGVRERFTVGDLSRVRMLVREAGVAAGIPAAKVAALVVAVNEIAGNAIRYGGGFATITLRGLLGLLLVEISDDGPGLPPDLVIVRPAADAVGGRGLWLAYRLCERVDMLSSAAGLTVRLHASLAGTGR